MEDHFLRKRSWDFGWTLRGSAVVIDSLGFADGLGLAIWTGGGGARVLEMDKDSFLRELG